MLVTTRRHKGIVYALALEGHKGDDIPFAYYDIYQPGADPLLPPVPLALERLKEWARDKGYDVRVDADVAAWYRRHLRTLRDAAARGLAVDVSNVYSSDGHGLYGYQQEGVQAILGNAAWDSDGRARILIADDPRLGKSPQALTALRLLGLGGPVLILCPKSLLDQWTEYVHAWLPEATPVTLGGTASQRQAQLRDALREHARPAIITNWETALMDLRDMFVTYWWAVIGDEAHRLKNRNSKITKAVGRLACHHLLLLSATFTERTSADWYAPLSLIAPERFNSFWRFAGWYTHLKFNGYGHVPTGTRNSDLLDEHLAPFVLRRRADQVADMPEVVEETILTRLSEPHQALYKQLERNVIVELQSRTLTIPNAAARIMRLRQAALHPALLDAEYYDGQITGKLEALRDLVNEEIPSHEQVLVYSSFVDGCHLAADAVGRSAAVYAGDSSDPDVIRLFQEGGIRTLCATPGKGGVGLNLFNANYVVFLDTPWSTVQLRQARERVRRVGKTEPVGVYTLVAKDTVDEYVVHHVLKKVDQIGEADVVRNVLDFYSGARYN